MSDNTRIEWSDATWNPIVGCTPVSTGCANCYAATLASRFYSMGDGARMTDGTGGTYREFPHALGAVAKCGKWLGKVRLNRRSLDQPIRWRKPRRIFVCSMSDIFHEDAPEDWIRAVFDAMRRAPQHVYQIITKRAKRMNAILPCIGGDEWMDRPPRNVWLGVSCENQETADERIPLLLRTPSAVKWVSAEPLLGDLNLRCSEIDWVVVGGESGPRARPCDISWIRSVVQQCKNAGTACFVKQLGKVPIGPQMPKEFLDRKGGDQREWPEDVRVREFPSHGANRNDGDDSARKDDR